MVGFAICAAVALAFGLGYAYGHNAGEETGVAEGRRQRDGEYLNAARAREIIAEHRKHK